MEVKMLIESWTGELIGKMHISEVRIDELAKEAGFSKGYISMILNCKKKPPGARERLEAAFERIIERRSA